MLDFFFEERERTMYTCSWSVKYWKINSHWPQSINIRRFWVTAEPWLKGAVWRLAIHVPRSCEKPKETKMVQGWCCVSIPRQENDRYKELLSPEGLDVHIFILLLTQAVFYEVLSLSCLAREHSLSHGAGSGAVTPRQRLVHAVKPWPETTGMEKEVYFRGRFYFGI